MLLLRDNIFVLFLINLLIVALRLYELMNSSEFLGRSIVFIFAFLKTSDKKRAFIPSKVPISRIFFYLFVFDR
jgi:hypothetical protein